MYDETSIWSELSKFQSSTISQSYLSKCYQNQGFSDYEKISYQNCFPFIYYLEHGEKYYRQMDSSPMELQPILLFYGMIQLLKAAILTRDPSYPETSQVLAHGVSTRKRKKSQYLFVNDEVKLQKNGLLSHFSDKLFHMKQFSSEKYKMRHLLRQIPEMHPLFHYIESKYAAYSLQYNNHHFLVPGRILDDFHVSLEGFSSFIRSRSDNVKEVREKEPNIEIIIKKPVDIHDALPFLFHMDGSFHLLREREDYIGIPEVAVHYLILYNLSMICRYETEWWGDLFHHYPESDFPFIKHFLEISRYKIPHMLFNFLNNQF